MKSPFKKKTLLNERVSQIESQMAALHKEIRRAERQRERPLSSAFPTYRDEQRDEGLKAPARGEEGRLGAAPDRAQPARDDRFANYLASSFQTMHPLKHERKILRNKAIFMLVVVTIVIIWVVWLARNVFTAP
jgi:hypothetical protein